MTRTISRLLTTVTIFLACLLDSTGHAQEQWPQTVAERSGFRRTGSYKEVAEFLRQIVARSDHLHSHSIGTTVEGRDIVAVTAGDSKTPASAARDGKLIVLLLGNIHAGECAGKEALLLLLRDLAQQPDHPWIEHLHLIVVPNYNADGNERMAPDNRPNQDGPAGGMGRRENAQELDLNRDFVKLESPEARALVGLMTRWKPHVFIDTHTTNGSRHRYQLTYDVPHNPAAPEPLRSFLRGEMLPEITTRLHKNGFETFYYGNFDEQHSRWTTYGHEPRYSTEYFGVRGGLSILAEAYSHIPYQDRIQVTHAFVSECLNYFAERHAQIRELVQAARSSLVRAGRQPAVPDKIAIRSELAKTDGKVTVLGYEGTSDSPKGYELDFFGIARPTLEVSRPAGYLIPASYCHIVDKLLQHGARLEQLTDQAKCAVQIQRITRLQRNASSFQRHHLLGAETESRGEERLVPQDTYLVRTAQPLGNLIAYLLEPEADDGLLAWDFFEPGLHEGDDYPVWRLESIDGLATRMVNEVTPARMLTLDEIYGPDGRVPFSGTFATVQWLPDSDDYVSRQQGRLMRVDAATGTNRPLYDQDKAQKAFEQLTGISTDDARGMSSLPAATFNSDYSAAVFEFADDLFYYKLGSDTARQLTRSKEPEKYASFSPDGRLVGFVHNYNLWVADVSTGETWALTTEGTADLPHGELDWVYQEEIYGRGQFRAFWWSPDSTRIAFLRLDEAPVQQYTVTDHIPVRGRLETTRYPKAGDPLPHPALGIARISNASVTWIERPQDDPENLIVRVGWSPDSAHVIFQVQNREQTWLELRKADRNSGQTALILREQSPAWIEVLGEPHWLEDGSMLWLSQRSGSSHIYHVSADGSARPITSGDWAVESLHGAADGWVYFSAHKDSATAMHCYRVRLDGTELQKLTARDGNHASRFNSKFTQFADYWSDVNSPVQTYLYRNNGDMIRAVEPNLVEHLKYYKIEPPEFQQVPAKDGTLLESMLIKPPDFDANRKYPVLCYVYSGPQAPVVANRWAGATYLWHQMLAQKGYVIWMCDNRSASTKGIRDTWPIHRQLGARELEDIEAGLDWLKQHHWVDADRIGIWGWSYGGYMTSYALTHSSSFKIGIAGAPVTDWRNYDAIYTERYMGLPQNNAEGYRTSSVVQAAGQLHGKLLIIHGTIDDNVHLSNTLQLAYELQKARKDFVMMLYPENRHGVGSPHLRDLMTAFVLENL